MNQNKNQLTTTIGTGVALKNLSKSLKITNKLLAEVDDFEKHWEWWLSLDDKLRTMLLRYGLHLDCVEYKLEWNEYAKADFIITKKNIDWFDKELMKNHIKSILKLTYIDLLGKGNHNISFFSHLTRACP